MIPARSVAIGHPLEILWAAGTFTGLSDAQLLGRFGERLDDTAEEAFRELLNRHGPMVMGVCRQILRRPQDADDAFQATFLVLIRKARSIRVGDSLAPWLYGVAYRTAHRARAAAVRFRNDADEPTAVVADPSAEVAFELDVRPLLHEELARLPGKYRDPIVLCHLEGKSHEEAARLLSWPVGTVSGRLARGRQLLKARLERRGVSAPSTMLAARWLTGSQAALSPSLLDATLGAAARFIAAGTIPTSILSLTQGVLTTMLLDKVKVLSLALVVAGAASGGAVWAIRTSRAANPASSPRNGAASSTQAKQDATGASAEPFTTTTQAGPALLRAAGHSSGPPMAIGTSVVSRPKNYPNLMVFPRDPVPVLRSPSLLVAESPDHRTLKVMSLEAEDVTWQDLTLPPGITASPLVSNDTVALILKGKSIDHVAAFAGKWSTQHLRKPVEDEVTPMVLPGGALYQVGHDLYAFSSRAGSWGTLHLEGGEEPKVTYSENDFEVLHGHRLYVFKLSHGRFSAGVEVNLKPFQREPEATKTAK